MRPGVSLLMAINAVTLLYAVGRPATAELQRKRKKEEEEEDEEEEEERRKKGRRRRRKKQKEQGEQEGGSSCEATMYLCVVCVKRLNSVFVFPFPFCCSGHVSSNDHTTGAGRLYQVCSNQKHATG